MKRVIPSLLLLLLLTSCVAQEGYYAPGYYPPPPPPYVEIHRHDEYRLGQRHHHHERRPVSQTRVYQSRRNPQVNAHGHESHQAGRQAVVQPQSQQPVVVQPRNLRNVRPAGQSPAVQHPAEDLTNVEEHH
ncbi:MAG: hypothetical protein QM652_11820 [Legionella sp.]|uniref:hypothetical protein n=1 Tax=Legionella sp. TaxID=459 RepID=UPI0039E45B6F